MELGDIINFLLIIAFAVVAPIIGAVSKRNKSKQQADKAATGANDSFVRDMEKASEQEMESAEHAVLDNHNLQNDGSGLSYQNHSYTSDFRQTSNKMAEFEKKSAKQDESRRRSQVTQKEMVRRNKKQDDPAEAARIARGFNIRKAVIFSEILNTKYF